MCCREGKDKGERVRLCFCWGLRISLVRRSEKRFVDVSWSIRCYYGYFFLVYFVRFDFVY